MFETMTHEKYAAAVNPKMKGAMALHKAFDARPLDFFVMTSKSSSRRAAIHLLIILL